MEYCKECTEVMIATDGNPSKEQLQKLGKPEAKEWCKICKELMMANYQLRQECDNQAKHFGQRHQKSEGFTRFDV
ncbi:hypothetical protein ACMXYX_06725 [Neptuniibacter sp. QD72_48]|uniref:hypothetical protein n=1 Tax=unclassified Neptuniibacter TaxID=2630693 RepID=UPI0039F6559A